MRVCSVPGCPALYPRTEGSRCARHRTEARRARTDNKVYSTKGHRTFRAAVLARDPVCVLCRTAIATVADHHPQSRRELEALGLNPNDPQYGRGLCHRCHSIETANNPDQRGGWNRRD